MNKEESVKLMTDKMAKFVGHIGKKLPDDVIAKLEELAAQETAPLPKVLYETMTKNQGLAVSLAESLNADPRAVVIATVIAGSCAYATPIGMPANTMVVGVGGYKFKDYVKSGLPLILVSFVLCMILLPILYPFYP